MTTARRAISALAICLALASAHDAIAQADTDGDAGTELADASTDVVVVAPIEVRAPHVDAEAPSEPNELPPLPVRPRRDGGEMVLLYMTSIAWGGSMAVFFDGLGQSTNVYASASVTGFLLPLVTGSLAAFLPTIVDHAYGYRPGVASTIASSMLLGFGEGIALNEYFANRAATSFHTYTKDASWVFGGASAGLVSGLVIAALVPTTPGRSAWIATTGLFGGVFAGSIAGAASRPAGYPVPPFDRDGNRNVGITSAIAGLAGIAGGVTTATWLSPSLLRVHLIDAGWILGAAIPALACIDHCKAPDSFLAISIGSGVGFVSTFLVTALLPKDVAPQSLHASAAIAPFAMPLATGGLEVGVGGPF